MPKYSSQPYQFKDAIETPFYPVDVVDANGKIIQGKDEENPRIIYFDTETGIVIRLDYEKQKPLLYFYDSHGIEEQGIVRIIELHPAPLTFVKHDDPNNPSPSIVSGT